MAAGAVCAVPGEERAPYVRDRREGGRHRWSKGVSRYVGAREIAPRIP